METVVVGAIVQAHGVRGLVRVKSFTADPEALCALGPLSDDQGRRYCLSLKGRVKELLLCAVEGIADRTAAEALRGVALRVARAALDDAALAEDEFYHADLVGLAVVTRDGRALGRVRAVHDFGAGDLLEVVDPATGRPLVLPFTRAVVPVVDLAGQRLVVEPPAGLLDDPAAWDGETGENGENGEDPAPPPAGKGP